MTAVLLLLACQGGKPEPEPEPGPCNLDDDQYLSMVREYTLNVSTPVGAGRGLIRGASASLSPCCAFRRRRR
jgi:hypothetical protein